MENSITCAMNCNFKITVPLIVVATVMSYQVKSTPPSLPDRPCSYICNALHFPPRTNVVLTVTVLCEDISGFLMSLDKC